MKFNELNLNEEILQSIEKLSFKETTKVQELVLPVSLSGKDLMVQSKTGSGKTAVFVLTILQSYILNKTKAIVIAPTRELALQIEEDAKKLSKMVKGFKTACFYGGVGYENQRKEIKAKPDLFIGTPGRLIDFATGGEIDFKSFDIVVLDEADRMFDMGFLPDIQKMFSKMKKERQTMLLSATLSTNVRNLAWDYMNDPVEIESEKEEITVKKIQQELYHVSKSEKFNLLLQLIKAQNINNAIIFTNTKQAAIEVATRLKMNDMSAAHLIGDMSQSDRIKTLNKLKTSKLDILVATDVAARGLQVDDLPFVINYDLPEEKESYVHRIGRTGRAGKTGKAITLACEDYIYSLEGIQELIQMKIPVVWPDDLAEVEDKSLNLNFNTKIKKKKIIKTIKEEKNFTKNNKKYEELSSLSIEDRVKMYQKNYSSNMKFKQKETAVKEPVVIERIKAEKKSFYSRFLRFFRAKK